MMRMIIAHLRPLSYTQTARAVQIRPRRPAPPAQADSCVYGEGFTCLSCRKRETFRPADPSDEFLEERKFFQLFWEKMVYFWRAPCYKGGEKRGGQSPDSDSFYFMDLT